MIYKLPKENDYYMFNNHKCRIYKSTYMFITYMYEDDKLENNHYIENELTIIFMLKANKV